MVQSKLTTQARVSSQSSSRGGVEVDTFLIHHQAGTNDDATINAMVSGSKQVSANYTISSEGRLTSVVPEEHRAWTSGSGSDGGKGAAWDKRSITVEIENETGEPDWRISKAAIATAAALLADLRTRYTIRNVLGHRDLWERYKASYPTYCPGPNTVAAIVAAEAALSTPTPDSEEFAVSDSQFKKLDQNDENIGKLAKKASEDAWESRVGMAVILGGAAPRNDNERAYVAEQKRQAAILEALAKKFDITV